MTFHQPPQVLRRNLLQGSQTGRISNLVHRLTRGRYHRLAAAIIISEDQRPVLEEYVAPKKIHLIPLGASTVTLIEAEGRLRRDPEPTHILTVGNWLRDWKFYLDFVDACRVKHPEWKFSLVNRNLPKEWHERAKAMPNLEWMRDVDDEVLLAAYAGAGCLFLPLIEATGNNTVNEALAMGCPIVTNVSLGIPNEAQLVTRCDKNLEDLASGIICWQSATPEERTRYRQNAQAAVKELDWSVTAAQTLGLYRSVIQS